MIYPASKAMIADDLFPVIRPRLAGLDGDLSIRRCVRIDGNSSVLPVLRRGDPIRATEEQIQAISLRLCNSDRVSTS